MTDSLHHEFAKNYLKELLSNFGQVETSYKLPRRVYEVDLWFNPSSRPINAGEELGLLGKVAATPCIFERFSEPVTVNQMCSLISKFFQVLADLKRQAEQENNSISEDELPKLWVITPTVSPEFLHGFGAIPDRENWGEGFYFLGWGFRIAFILIDQLPCTPETQSLRKFCEGIVPQKAINEDED